MRCDGIARGLLVVVLSGCGIAVANDWLGRREILSWPATTTTTTMIHSVSVIRLTG